MYLSFSKGSWLFGCCVACFPKKTLDLWCLQNRVYKVVLTSTESCWNQKRCWKYLGKLFELWKGCYSEQRLSPTYWNRGMYIATHLYFNGQTDVWAKSAQPHASTVNIFVSCCKGGRWDVYKYVQHPVWIFYTFW